ncbi:transglycosylase SLT domain-containing protein [Pseudoroseicyclus aestuarii]|uniref:Transglycosylase-like protein with SLT domain n=1 Tax=Pseudoroseicyclus aestuarii TaxID=1795041 RepID=A0A318SNW9_9RHOB|nr:lytic transglycosylase domain-containing protein [Pseudoroseicyclus aestuarii]PYE81275.1 transglycosylase-like protein with SLT domain [Pseudoroseicyclus aestuarii]
MPHLTRRALVLCLGTLPLAACAGREPPEPVAQGGDAQVRALVDQYATYYDVPRDLVHRVVKRESSYNPRARNGPYYGLMQIHPQTARTMGFRGAPSDLLDAETNLRYAVRYLRGAWLVSDGDRDEAVGWYSRGYYYEARDRGLLEATGLR